MLVDFAKRKLLLLKKPESREEAIKQLTTSDEYSGLDYIDCIEAVLVDYDLDLRYPNRCRKCDGIGIFVDSYDPSPPGVALSPGRIMDFEPCDACYGRSICPLCGTQHDEEWVEDEKPCPVCGWDPEKGRPFIEFNPPDEEKTWVEEVIEALRLLRDKDTVEKAIESLLTPVAGFETMLDGVVHVLDAKKTDILKKSMG